MAASKGSIFKQGRIFWFQFRVGGKRERFSLETAIWAEAQEKALNIRKRLDLGINPIQAAKESITIRELVERYKAYSLTRKAPTTADRDRNALDKFAAALGSRLPG